MPTTAALECLIAPAVATLGFELVSCHFVSEHGRRTLRVLIDSPEGVTVEDCSHASRQINAILAAEAAITDPYDLEVSSPGLDRPLITVAHYLRFMNSQVKIKLRDPIEGQRNFIGRLIAATPDKVQIEVNGKAVELVFDNIEKANLVPDVRF